MFDVCKKILLLLSWSLTNAGLGFQYALYLQSLKYSTIDDLIYKTFEPAGAESYPIH